MYGSRYNSRDESHLPWWFYAGMAFFMFVILPLITGAMTDDGKAIRAAEEAGYTNVKILDKGVYFPGLRGCGGSDQAVYTVAGIDRDGSTKTILACAGIFKGGTVRSR